MLVYALSSTLPMFIGQNLGAGRKDRVWDSIRIAFRFVLLFQLLVYLLLALTATSIGPIFSDDTGVQETLTLFLYIVPLTYGVSGMVILINVAMNVLGQPRRALYINILRLSLFYFPMAWLGARLYGLHGLFAGIAVGNLSAWLMARWFLHRTLRELDIREPQLAAESG